jgi:hypothetical protein
MLRGAFRAKLEEEPPVLSRAMLGAKQERVLATFHAGLCRMMDGALIPYEGTPIEADSEAEAIKKAKEWAALAETLSESWLQVALDGETIVSFKPGEF